MTKIVEIKLMTEQRLTPALARYLIARIKYERKTDYFPFHATAEMSLGTQAAWENCGLMVSGVNGRADFCGVTIYATLHAPNGQITFKDDSDEVFAVVTGLPILPEYESFYIPNEEDR